jgi:hypothetical protein
LRSLVQTIYFTACGLFTPTEVSIVNLVYFISIAIHQAYFIQSVHVITNISQLLIFCGFNIAEAFFHYRFEMQCFYQMAESNKTSIQYIKFVNRLLPTHVGVL